VRHVSDEEGRTTALKSRGKKGKSSQPVLEGQGDTCVQWKEKSSACQPQEEAGQDLQRCRRLSIDLEKKTGGAMFLKGKKKVFPPIDEREGQ